MIVEYSTYWSINYLHFGSVRSKIRRNRFLHENRQIVILYNYYLGNTLIVPNKQDDYFWIRYDRLRVSYNCRYISFLFFETLCIQ